MWKLLLRSEAKGTPGVYESLVAKALGQRERRVCYCGRHQRACLFVCGQALSCPGPEPTLSYARACWLAGEQPDQLGERACGIAWRRHLPASIGAARAAG